MSPDRRLTLVPLALICALGVAACGSDKRKESSTGTAASETGTTAEKAPTGPVVGTQKVSETEFKLTPANPDVAKAGVTEIKATNDGQIDHAIEVEGQGIEVKSGIIKPGSSGSVKADLKPGTYEWYCPIDAHKQKGMKGTITVGSVKSGASSEGSKTTTSSDTSTSGSSSGGSSGGGAAYDNGSSSGGSSGGGAAYP